jgi:hypothetical protein
MIAPTQIRKPENWQDFEKLCKKLWGEIWSCSDSIKRNGRSGQNQRGVDIYGKPKGENAYYGIQCKGKDDYSQSKLTRPEIDSEIEKAKSFLPKLSKFIFATTANKDVEIEEYIREKDLQSVDNGSFSIELYCWEDIVDLLEEYRKTFNWYINNCQYKDLSDIEVYLDWGKEIDIHPEYIRTTRIFHKKNEVYLCQNHYLSAFYKQMADIKPITHYNDIFNPPIKVDYRWCTIPINIKNTGTTVIEDYTLYLVFEEDKIEDLDDKFRAFNPGPLFDQSAVIQENVRRQNMQEVFESDDYSNCIEYRPKKALLVQDDCRTFKIGIKPKDNVNIIRLQWLILSRDYSKEGELVINVVPKYDEKEEPIEVKNVSNMKPTEVLIEPKIVEE